MILIVANLLQMGLVEQGQYIHHLVWMIEQHGTWCEHRAYATLTPVGYTARPQLAISCIDQIAERQAIAPMKPTEGVERLDAIDISRAKQEYGT